MSDESAPPASPPASLAASGAVSGNAINFARTVIETEAAVLRQVGGKLGASFSAAVETVLNCEGRIVVTGMGKAGLVGQKIAATLASTGSPAFFLHPAEALHGDLGMVRPEDVVLVLSNSGETEEIVRLLPHVRDRLPIISITRDAESPLGAAANHLLELGHIEEACPLGLAPSASTTAMLAIGDALALTAEHQRGFSDEDFARFHPGGSLGRRFQRVAEVMRRDRRLPLVQPETLVVDTVKAITDAHAGCAIVVDEKNLLIGVFTDGDFRDLWLTDDQAARKQVSEFMTSPCLSVSDQERVKTAQQLMHQKRINALPVVDGEGRVVGLLDIQDIIA